jgi:hypothetical protein
VTRAVFEHLFSSMQNNEQVLQTALRDVLARQIDNFRWFGAAYTDLQRGLFTMPDGMNNLALGVGFAFHMAFRFVADGKLSEQAALNMAGDIALMLQGVMDKDERSRRLGGALMNLLFSPVEERST